MTVYIPVPLSSVLLVTIENGGAIVIPIRLTADQITILGGGPEAFEEAHNFRLSLFTRLQAHILNNPGAQRFVGKDATGMFLVNSRSEYGVVLPFDGEPQNVASIDVLDITDMPTGVPPIVRN